jgi:hypothetical protein
MNAEHLERATLKGQATSAKNTSTKQGPTTSPFWRPSSKIRDRHWQRLAVVYVRQSSPHQVLENRESRERQYGLAQLAQQFGWPADRVLVIDEDQGLSGKSSEKREGFQRLLTEVTLDHVGLVLGLELSRLARSCKDWHHLVEVCAVCGFGEPRWRLCSAHSRARRAWPKMAATPAATTSTPRTRTKASTAARAKPLKTLIKESRATFT